MEKGPNPKISCELTCNRGQTGQSVKTMSWEKKEDYYFLAILEPMVKNSDPNLNRPFHK